MGDLRKKLIKLAHDKPETRKHILPLLKESSTKQAGAVDFINGLNEVRDGLRKARRGLKGLEFSDPRTGPAIKVKLEMMFARLDDILRMSV